MVYSTVKHPYEQSDTQSWIKYECASYTESEAHHCLLACKVLPALLRARVEHSGIDCHQHIFLHDFFFDIFICMFQNILRVMEWCELGGTPGGYLVQTLSQSRANSTARSCFFNKLFSRSFRNRLAAKSIILHVSSNRFILMTKRKQPWSPICNLRQTMVNKAITLTLDLTYMTGIKNGVRQDVGTMHMCLFKFFRSFHYQETCQTCSQKCLVYPCSSGFQLL